MRNTYTILLLLSLATVLSASKCKSVSSPPEFYFKCKVDGKEYIPNGCTNCLSVKLLGDTTLLLTANNGFESLLIGIVNKSADPIRTTVYELNHTSQRKASFKNGPGISDVFQTDSLHRGEIRILELDKTNSILSGTFLFVGYNHSQQSSLNISEGSFRLKYKLN